MATISSPKDLFGEKGLFSPSKKALMARALRAEMTHHPDYEKGAAG